MPTSTLLAKGLDIFSGLEHDRRELLALVKEAFDYEIEMRQALGNKVPSPGLLIRGHDNASIWRQIQLVHKPLLARMDRVIGTLLQDMDQRDALEDTVFSVSSQETEPENVDLDTECSESKSTYQRYRGKLRRQISQLEQENIRDKPWTMVGEVKGCDRPENGLLEQVLEFDHVAKPVPIITEQVRESIEDMIRERIMDQRWDDPEKVQLEPPIIPEPFPVSQEKSKQSLTEIYEEEHMEKQSRTRDDGKLVGSRKSIEELWNNLNRSLNSLANFDYAPHKSSKISVPSVPAMLMEESTPLATNLGDRTTPEEIYRPNKHGFKAKSELDSREKHSRHLKKKRLQKNGQMLKQLSKQRNVTVQRVP